MNNLLDLILNSILGSLIQKSEIYVKKLLLKLSFTLSFGLIKADDKTLKCFCNKGMV